MNSLKKRIQNRCCGFCGQGTWYRFSRNQAEEATFSASCGRCGFLNWYRYSTKQQGLAAFRRRLQYHKLAELLDYLPEPIRMEMEEIDRTKRKEAAATTSRQKKFA